MKSNELMGTLVAGLSSNIRNSIGEIWRYFTTLYSKIKIRIIDKPDTYIVICGYPRSGTSLLYNMISSSLCKFEFEPFEVNFIYRIHRLGNIASKAPMDIFNLKKLDKLNIHNKKIIVLIIIRDIRDIITSIHPILPDRYFIGYDYSWWPQDKLFKKWGYSAPGIKNIHKEIKKIQNNSTLNYNPLIIKYEDIITTPDKLQKLLSQRYALNFSSLFSEFYKYPDKHQYKYEGKTKAKDQSLVKENQAVTSSRKGKWRDPKHKDRILSEFIKHPELFKILIDYGYEKNSKWFADY